MTYQHALRYLTGRQDEATLPISELRALLGMPTAPILVRISHDKQASVAARFLRTMLCEADVGCLHVIESDDHETRDRFMLNGAPIPPATLCAHAHTLHNREIMLRRQPDASGYTFPIVERTAVLLLRIATEQHVRVLIVESNDTALADALTTYASPVSLTAVSATDAGGRRALSSIGSTTAEVVTHALGAAVIRMLSDACAGIDSRLTVIPRAAIRRREVTQASQVVDTSVLSDCRLPAGTALATDAAALALQIVASLRRLGVSITDEQARRGLGRTVLTSELSPISVTPLVIADCAHTPTELLWSLRELAGMSLPRPHRLYLDSALSLPSEYACAFDAICEHPEPFIPEESGTTIVIGSRSFLMQLPKKYAQTQKNV